MALDGALSVTSTCAKQVNERIMAGKNSKSLFISAYSGSGEEGDVVFGCYLFTIMTAQLEVGFIHHIKPGRDRFMIGDAVRVKAFHDVFDFVGNRDLFFLHHRVILDHDHGGRRRHERDLVDFVGGEIFVFYFDDPFGAHFPAFEVRPKQYLVIDF